MRNGNPILITAGGIIEKNRDERLEREKAANFGRKSYLKLFHSTGICQGRVLKDTEIIPEA